MSLVIKTHKPDPVIAPYVDSLWMLHNPDKEDKKVVVLPDGRIDIFLSQSTSESFHITLHGLGTEPGQGLIHAGTLTFAISFNLPAAEYILHQSVTELVNKVGGLPNTFWNYTVNDLQHFDDFCAKTTRQIKSLVPADPDTRKLQLFELLAATEGNISVKELSEKVFWSSRQINRYFNQQFGISLKAYCNILRFRASLQHLSEGKLFPEQHFADQSHFIKAVKKLTGVTPKELFQNQNDRFVQFSAMKSD
ncbi:AraC-like DNA-binding protein [Chitinophaga dinghuensis]|uniref:AraC-like DNA-binding protein n=1 Tax=Chitinophaga dinghuensis TaxID=1539050 RepID=A0A327W2F5_9BACT|nr:AraC family transcriptional regulator [Chitinophaga dinghuensis]RAJ83457.1 AraC-like DNA-binding protein [Chitinophaga dinghuensis]